MPLQSYTVGNRGIKLGKQAARYDARTLQFSNYMKVTAPPSPPKLEDWAKKVQTWPMMLNDTLGLVGRFRSQRVVVDRRLLPVTSVTSKAAGSSREGTTRQRQRHHPDRSYRRAASCGIAGLRAAVPTARQGSLHAHVSRSEDRPMIAVDTSTCILAIGNGQAS
jgi:hypothetical protein